MFSAVIKETKRGKKGKRHKDDSSDDSDSDWHESADHVGRIHVKRRNSNLEKKQGSDGSHLFTIDSKLSNDENYNYVANYSSNVDCLTNNLFVYNNKKSYPACLRKNVREQIQFSPEVVGILLPDVNQSHSNKK